MLIVDDNEDARTTFSESLVKFGYVVMGAPDGRHIRDAILETDQIEALDFPM